MNIIDAVKSLVVALIMFTATQVYAEKPPFIVLEVMANKVRVAQDGTGVVQDVACNACESSLLKITPASRATEAGVEVNILEVRKLGDKVVMVSFTPETQEVQFIRW
jgi:hypothetical protein